MEPMTRSDAAFAAHGRGWFNQTERLNRVESVALLALLAVMVTFDVIGFVTSGTNHLDHLVSVVSTLTLALYIWSPLVATSLLGVTVALSLTTAYASASITAGSLAALLVLRLASSPLIIAYFGGLLLATAAVTSGISPSVIAPPEMAIYLLVAAVAGSIGIALRTAYARGRRLEYQLAEREEHERQAIVAERRWIAGELHDSIAHQLTIISLHTQLLDDDEMRDASQEAIRTAARKALSDLRFIIKLAEDAPAGTEVSAGDLKAAIDEAREEFRGAGHSVVLEGDLHDEGIPRGAEIVLARVVRESATNIIKYAGPGDVRFVLDVQPEAITMTISSPLATGSTPRVASSSGTGLNRMAGRVLGVSGEFSAGPVGNEWQVRTYLPLGSLPNSHETRVAGIGA